MGPDVSIYAAVMDMKSKGLCPVIAFHLDTFMALSLFKELLKVELLESIITGGLEMNSLIGRLIDWMNSLTGWLNSFIC